MSAICPYCDKPIVEHSEDHVFSVFLGGRRTISCCKPCNDRFGFSFEASVSEMVKAMRVSMRTWGLQLAGSGETWKSAHEHEGLKFDLSSDGIRTGLRLSTPIPERAADGTTSAVWFGTLAEAERALRNTRRKGRSGSIEKTSTEVGFSGAHFNFQVDRALYRTALKMCTAISVLDPRFSSLDTGYARLVLQGDAQSDPVPNVRIAFDNYGSLDSLRPPLSHVIYVERRSGRTCGVVQFFGVIQLFVDMGIAPRLAADAAILGVLDPLSGVERFDATIESLNLPDPRPLEEKDITESNGMWLRKFEESAIARGATSPPQLSGRLSLRKY
jgi:HNH endonuclease